MVLAGAGRLWFWAAMAPSRKPALAFAMAPGLEAGVFEPVELERLAAVAEILDSRPLADFSEARASGLLARAEILVTGWMCPYLDAAVLARAPHLGLIAHAAGTIRFTVAPEAFARGIRVVSAAAANAVPVAEFALAAILLVNKRAFRLREIYRRDARSAVGEMPWIGNRRRRVGLVGASRVGRCLIELLRPFEIEVWVTDPYLDPAEATALGVRLASLSELLAACDVVSLHAPLLDSTRGMIGPRELAQMRTGATLINTARGALVDEAALVREVTSGRIDAVLDTVEPEPPPRESALYATEGIFLTPHIAGAMGEEVARLGALVVDEIERFVAGTELHHEVHAEDLGRLA